MSHHTLECICLVVISYCSHCHFLQDITDSKAELLARVQSLRNVRISHAFSSLHFFPCFCLFLLYALTFEHMDLCMPTHTDTSGYIHTQCRHVLPVSMNNLYTLAPLWRISALITDVLKNLCVIVACFIRGDPLLE